MYRIVLILVTLFLWPVEIFADHLAGHQGFSPPRPYIGQSPQDYQRQRDLYEQQRPILNELQRQNDLIREQQRQQQEEQQRQQQQEQQRGIYETWRQQGEFNRRQLERQRQGW